VARGMNWERANARDRARDRARAAKPMPVVVAWWLTPSPGGRCPACGNPVARGQAVAYNHAEVRSLCQVCWERAGIVPQPSKRWKRRHRSTEDGA
jgi:hypothetical protein